ncbi:MAG TPA: MarR family transcriptional regulator [Terriglobia bacterium]|nr:MarR family transcriptional regulator [Terriglobia bacterium]
MAGKLKKRGLVAWRAFLTAHALVLERIDRDLVDAGVLPLTWYDVLYTLYLGPGRRRRMADLAQAVLLSRSGLTRLVDRIEKKRLLRREMCPSDRRGAFAVLTGKGLDALRQTWPVYAHGIQRHFAGPLSEAEVRTLARSLARLAQSDDHAS